MPAWITVPAESVSVTPAFTTVVIGISTSPESVVSFDTSAPSDCPPELLDEVEVDVELEVDVLVEELVLDTDELPPVPLVVASLLPQAKSGSAAKKSTARGFRPSFIVLVSSKQRRQKVISAEPSPPR
jgi:hypothetical protein